MKGQHPPRRPGNPTSWEPVEKWYNAAVGAEGHYYHQNIIIPGVLRLLKLNPQASLLDLGCGNGVLARHLPEKVTYLGLDTSISLIKSAKQQDRNPGHEYVVADVTQPLPISKRTFSDSAAILSLQNIEEPKQVMKNVHRHLDVDGRFLIVLNHPCFRIPRQSSWQVDSSKKTQYRRLDRYASPMKIPIHAHPSKGKESAVTWTFHFPLSDYSRWLYDAGFVIEILEEWCSDKVSTGSAAKMENRSREEFPLFLAILARKTK